MDQKMSKIIHGSEIFLGMSFFIKDLSHLSFLQMKIISTQITQMESGKIKIVNRFNKICNC